LAKISLIKNKLVTAVTTAGLLAGLFGSAFVPAANAAGTDVDAVAIRNSFTEAEDGYAVDLLVVLDPTGSATRPYVLYAPLANTGGAAATAVEDFVCFEIAEADLVDKNGDALSDQDDVRASVSVSGSIILFADDTADAADVASADEGDYGTAAFTSDSITDGIAFCATVSDDDLAGSGIVTVRVNNVVVRTVHITVAGPTTSVATASRVGEWVAMDNDAVPGAIGVTFRDATGRSLYATGIDLQDIEDYAIRGAEANSDIRYYVDDVAVGDDDSALASQAAGDAAQRRVDLAADLCDSTTDDVGATHTVYVVIDRDGDGADTRESGDLVSNGTTFKCSDSAANWSLKGLSFYDFVSTVTEVALGDYVYLTIDVEDGSGNPLGVGIDAPLTLLIAENTLEQAGDPVGASFFPIELDAGEDAAEYDATGAQLFEVNAVTGACSADGANVDIATVGDGAVNFLEAGKVFLCYQASYNVTGKHVVRMTLDQYEDATDFELAQQTVSASITVVDPSASGTTGSSAATIARNAAKRTATITIPAAAGRLVTITIENVKTGATKTYYRKAAAVTGVAKFTLRKAGKWEVFASYSNLVTDTVKLKK
jgi:hypothetical protein